MATSKMTMSTLRAPRVPSRFDVGTYRRSTRLAATYKITVTKGKSKFAEFDCNDDQYVLEAAEDAKVELPFSCRAGSCSTCAGLVTKGVLDDSESDFLTSTQQDAGYVLTCIAYPKSDATFETEVEESMPA